MNQPHSHPVTELLVRWKAGDQEALEALVPLVYKELRDIARYHLRRERPDHTLQSAALVHEAYLRLVDQRPFDSENRAHFLAVASRLMRQILVDYAHPRSSQAGCGPHRRARCLAHPASGAEHGCRCARRRAERAFQVGRTAGPHCRVALFRRVGY